MSEIKNGGLDQYGKVWSLNGIGGERVNNTVQGVTETQPLQDFVHYFHNHWEFLAQNFHDTVVADRLRVLSDFRLDKLTT